MGKCDIIIAESKVVKSNKDHVFWSSQKFSSSDYKPLNVFQEIVEIGSIDQNIDFVLLSLNNIESLKNIQKTLQKVIDDNTIILVDSTYSINLEELVINCYPNNIVLTLFSEVMVKISVYEEKNEFNHVGNKVSTLVGSSSKNPRKDILESLSGLNTSGKKLNELIQILLSNGVFPCNIIQNGVKPTIQSYIWKSILPFVSFGVLSLIYGNLKMDNPIHNLMIKNCFHDIINLANLTCKDELPDIKEKSKVNQLFDQLMKQFNDLHNKFKVNLVDTSNESYSFMDSMEYPLCIYNYLYNFDNYVPLCLNQIINMASNLEVEVPYIQCINSFYLEIEKIQVKKIYNWIKKDLYQNEKSKVPNQVIQNESANSSSNQLFERFDSGNTTPITLVNNTVPQTYVYYPTPGEIAMAQDRKPFTYYNIPSNNPEFNSGSNVLQKSVLPHPRFKNIPKDKINGKTIPYNQVKGMIYPKTRGSTVSSDLAEAHKHLYRYGNLNKTFETVNNRYGWSDSLNIFKISNGMDNSIDEPKDAQSNINDNNQLKSIETCTENDSESDDDIDMQDAAQE